jgi:hypothetical protein
MSERSMRTPSGSGLANTPSRTGRIHSRYPRTLARAAVVPPGGEPGDDGRSPIGYNSATPRSAMSASQPHTAPSTNRSATATVEGRAFVMSEVVETAFDEIFPGETFVFTPPPGRGSSVDRRPIRAATSPHDRAGGCPACRPPSRCAPPQHVQHVDRAAVDPARDHLPVTSSNTAKRTRVRVNVQPDPTHIVRMAGARHCVVAAEGPNRRPVELRAMRGALTISLPQPRATRPSGLVASVLQGERQTTGLDDEQERRSSLLLVDETSTGWGSVMYARAERPDARP